MRKLFAMSFACLALVALSACASAVNTGAGFVGSVLDRYCAESDPDIRALLRDKISANSTAEIEVRCPAGTPGAEDTAAETEKEVSNLGNGNSLEPGTNRLAYWRGGDNRERDYSALSDAGEEPGIGRHLARSEYPRREHRQEPERRRHLA